MNIQSKSNRPFSIIQSLAKSTTSFPTLLVAGGARAGTLYWDGGTVDIGTAGNGISGGTAGNWNTTLLNWDVGVAPHVA